MRSSESGYIHPQRETVEKCVSELSRRVIGRPITFEDISLTNEIDSIATEDEKGRLILDCRVVDCSRTCVLTFMTDGTVVADTEYSTGECAKFNASK